MREISKTNSLDRGTVKVSAISRGCGDEQISIVLPSGRVINVGRAVEEGGVRESAEEQVNSENI